MNKKIKILLITIAIVSIIVILLFRGGEEKDPATENEFENPFNPSSTRVLEPTPIPNEGLGDSQSVNSVVLLDENTREEDPLPRLFQIHSSPVAGFFAKTSDSVLDVSLIERGTGHIQSIAIKPFVRSRVEERTIPKTVFALIGEKEPFFVQYEQPETPEPLQSLLIFPNEVDNNRISFINGDLEGVISKVTSQLFFLRKTQTGVEGLLHNPNSKTTKVIWRSQFGDWRAQWENDGKSILLSTKPSASSSSFVYRLYLNGATERISGGRENLSILTNKSSSIYLQYYNDGVLQETSEIVQENGNGVFELDDLAYPDKCDWSGEVLICGVPKDKTPESFSNRPILFPDSWYFGDVSFDDRIVAFSPPYTRSVTVVDPGSFGVSLDIIEPQVVGQFLVFINKKDLSLWGARISTQ